MNIGSLVMFVEGLIFNAPLVLSMTLGAILIILWAGVFIGYPTDMTKEEMDVEIELMNGQHFMSYIIFGFVSFMLVVISILQLFTFIMG